jgi:hypothetical protein
MTNFGIDNQLVINVSMAGTKDLFANFSIGHAYLIDPSYLRKTTLIRINNRHCEARSNPELCGT